MDNKVTYGIIGLLAGIILTWLFAANAVNGNNTNMMRMMGMHETVNVQDSHHDDYGSRVMSHSMREMMEGIDNKTGDEFDKAFLEQMIIHHEGAIEMANGALKDAKHAEIKTMANDIISAQTKEINQMKEWQRTWYNIQ